MSHSFNDEDFNKLDRGLKRNEDINVDKEVRHVRLILDHTAFVRGIGNVKRWFNKEYINSNVTRKNELIKLHIFIPSYTLHEFDFAKKGTSISATNAREAIRFIDTYFENAESLFENENDIELQNSMQINVEIESLNDNVPTWNQCSQYKIHSPKVKEFPNFKTTFDSHVIGHNPNSAYDLRSDENYDHSVLNATNSQFSTESSSNYQQMMASQELYAEMPVRLKYLIRTCIFKRFIERSNVKIDNEIEHWKLVTENSVTKIWAKSFGIDCLNINEAELLIFQKYDVNSFRAYNPFNIEEEFDPRSNILQNTIDTTLYSYKESQIEPVSLVDYKKTKKGFRKAKVKKSPDDFTPIEGVVNYSDDQRNSNIIKKEKFSAINYAPRGKGELWRPS